MKKNSEFTVIMPALNEERNIILAIKNVLSGFEKSAVSGEIIVVSDGSTDKTENLVRDFMQTDERVRLVVHDKARGIGASFWDGVDQAYGAAIVLLPGDNENDPMEIFRYAPLLEHVDIVVPFVFNREARAFFRNILSSVYCSIINATFHTNFNYTNGTVLYRTSVLKELSNRNFNFFFQTDILVRLISQGYLFAEVPYRLDIRKGGVSKAVSLASLMKVIRGYVRLAADFYFGGKRANEKGFAKDSMTFQRKNFSAPCDVPVVVVQSAHG